MCFGPANAQKIYKYVDSDGNTIYSQRLPAGVQGEELKPKFRTVSPNQAESELERLRERANPKTEPDYAAQQAEENERIAKIEKQNCEQAKKNLQISYFLRPSGVL